jgi:anti-sigma B factor antagonist
MSRPSQFASRFEIDDETRVCVVSLTGDLGPAAVGDLHPQIQELVRAGFRYFVFDLAALDHLGSLGLRLLVGLANQLKGDGAVALCAVPEAVRGVFALAKLGGVLPAYPSRADAVSAVRIRRATATPAGRRPPAPPPTSRPASSRRRRPRRW